MPSPASGRAFSGEAALKEIVKQPLLSLYSLAE
jgi:hypothetical protein